MSLSCFELCIAFMLKDVQLAVADLEIWRDDAASRTKNSHQKAVVKSR